MFAFAFFNRATNEAIASGHAIVFFVFADGMRTIPAQTNIDSHQFGPLNYLCDNGVTFVLSDSYLLTNGKMT